MRRSFLFTKRVWRVMTPKALSWDRTRSSPFRDGVEQAAEAGVSAIVQPGGSVRDEDVIKAADEFDIAMVFTGKRQFRH